MRQLITPGEGRTYVRQRTDDSHAPPDSEAMSLTLRPILSLMAAAHEAAARWSSVALAVTRRPSIGREPPTRGHAGEPALPARYAIAEPPTPHSADLLHSSSLHLEFAMTRDAVPVNLVAMLAWRVVAVPALLHADLHKDQMLHSAARRQLRALVLASDVGALLADPEAAEATLLARLEPAAARWGLSVCMVVIRHVEIPVRVQFDADVTQILAMRDCRARRRARQAAPGGPAGA